jgi:hypothetical protein
VGKARRPPSEWSLYLINGLKRFIKQALAVFIAVKLAHSEEV